VDDHAVQVVHALVGVGVVGEHLRHRAAERRVGLEPPDGLARQHAGLRGVEPHHRDGRAAGEHGRRGLGVGQDVEFREARRVAEPDAAAHDGDVPEIRGELRLLLHGEGRVGERPQREQLKAAAVLFRHAREELGGAALVRAQARVELDRVPQPAGPVDVGGGARRAHERAGAARKDRDLRPAAELDRDERVVDGHVEPDVAAQGDDAENVEFRPVQQHAQGDKIVDARVGADDERTLVHKIAPLSFFARILPYISEKNSRNGQNFRKGVAKKHKAKKRNQKPLETMV